ncbi:hypothetical protein N1028_13820 [Herbiconiux sp. CPCC 203407]|uniref:Uncharacterized protein n=1 Tax=Herbiconiux oxytropis TaxID=2970915 RepID=A0AA41XIB8_9MICO|nr:hypothetical protein [Herbiconiux oxytropis]MCS5724093.1 hypothetical protein [Herbiconiux oxytropis]MCS5726974.1 hypothetical protein [Herbiconiux oxytropis]
MAGSGNDRLSPRVAGWLAIAGSLVVAVVGGFLLANPPWSILGAFVLVAATIVLSVGTVWLHRRSWHEPWPPDATPSLQQQIRRLRVLSIVGSILWVGMIAAGVVAIVSQNGWRLLFVAFFLVTGLSNLSLNRRTLRLLQESRSEDGSASAAR